MIKLRLAPFVKVLLANAFPRTTITTRLSVSQAFQDGPFRSRVTAERFEQELLDLFQVRRCQDDLKVSPDHPGCIYGEMMRCLRPCQDVVGPEDTGRKSTGWFTFCRRAARACWSLLRGLATVSVKSWISSRRSASTSGITALSRC
ncbi:MAG: hypothetical protein QM757_35150 [Paludibaculum sp.]